MSKHQISLIAAALFVAAAVAHLPSPARAARDVPVKFTVVGRVFCDTCLTGFETPASTYLSGAKVTVECRSRSTGSHTCSFDGVTDSTGTYRIQVSGDHENEICESFLVSSPESTCASTKGGRERAPVFLTENNGMASSKRYANALGFQRTSPLAICAQILTQYEQL